MRAEIDRLRMERRLPTELLRELLTHCDAQTLEYIQGQACEVSTEHFGKGIYIRGLIEVTNYCGNDCYYCGIRKSNSQVERYRLEDETLLACCEQGYALGFRTFVLQGGEEAGRRRDDRRIEAVASIRQRYPDCAITLSLGERPRHTYERYFEAGANRYLLRHESYNEAHYRQLHPPEMSIAHRLNCLEELRDIGFQTGTGIMVGSPGQRVDDLVADIEFIDRFRPQMIGIGPFLPHHHTPFASCPAGGLEQTLLLLSIFRLMHPSALIPATTALATLASDGRERGILAGANVVMPNLSPRETRRKYDLYDNKASLGAEAAEGVELLDKQLQAIGYHVLRERGDFRPLTT